MTRATPLKAMFSLVVAVIGNSVFSAAKWVPLPSDASIAKPVELAMTKRNVNKNEVHMEFAITGGTDKMSLHLTPLDGFTLTNWSFTDFHPEMFGARRTFFVFLAYGAEAPEQRTFSVLLTHVCLYWSLKEYGLSPSA